MAAATNVLAQARRTTEPGLTAARNPALPGGNGWTNSYSLSWHHSGHPCLIINYHQKMVTGRQNLAVVEHTPSLVLASKLVVGFWVFVVGKAVAVLRGGLRSYANDLRLAQACVVNFRVRRRWHRAGSWVRATGEQQR